MDEESHGTKICLLVVQSLAQVAQLSPVNRTPEIVAADPREDFWALLG